MNRKIDISTIRARRIIEEELCEDGKYNVWQTWPITKRIIRRLKKESEPESKKENL